MSTQSICSICGANYEYLNGRWRCPACGAYKAEELSNEEVTLLYSAAQKLRLSNFSEAEEAYSDIIEKYPENASAYWGRLLSKYGIKYEEDFDGRKIPTCYATSIESVTEDKDYQKALELADAENQVHFANQASYIERVRKEWVEKASKEKPYDIFLCYKESDREAGIERTTDSVAVQDLYIHFTNQGYRVFYSRESLREKVGEKYEPYIFNALATAKVMLVYGSTAEYIKSTWLKNEWHRFYKKIASGEKHQEALLIACDGFSPNELPSVLSSRQCFDAQRKTFFLDLDRCVKRIIQESPKNETPYAKKEEPIFSGLHEHKYKTKIVKSTCIAKGYTLHKCDCGYEYRDSYMPLVDHKFKIIEKIPPTCTSDGHEEKSCEICGEKTTVILPALGHQYSKWVESKHPTCTEDGEEQRKCLRCGITETKILPKVGHQFGGWTINPDGTNTSYCQNCGISKTKEYVSSNGYHRNAAQSRDETNTQSITLKAVVHNWCSYWKSFFNSETTKAQKAFHFSWYSYFIAMLFLFATIGSQTVDESTVTITSGVTAVALIVMFFSVPIGIGSLIALIIQTVKRKKNDLPLSSNGYSRTWLKIISNFLFIYCPLFGSLAFSTDDPTSAPAIMLAVIFGIWAIITMFYAHCPKKFQNIQIGNSITFKRSRLTIVGLLATGASFVTMIVWIVLVTA